MTLALPSPTLLRTAASNLRRYVRWTELYLRESVQWRATGRHLGEVWRTSDTAWGWRCCIGFAPVEGDHYYTSRGNATKALLLHVADKIESVCSDAKEKEA